MSPSTEMREEIRGKRGSEGEASPTATARGKTEVTHRKMLPHSQRKKREASKKVAERQRKAEGKLPTARGEVGL